MENSKIGANVPEVLNRMQSNRMFDFTNIKFRENQLYFIIELPAAATDIYFKRVEAARELCHYFPDIYPIGNGFYTGPGVMVLTCRHYNFTN